MKIVLDTNILINTTHAPNGASGFILKRVKSGKITLVVSSAILSEYNRELGRSYLQRFRNNNDLTNKASFDQIIKNAKKVEPDIEVTDSDDPADNKFLECAVYAEVDYLISSDDDLLSLRPYEKVDIFQPQEFRDKIS